MAFCFTENNPLLSHPAFAQAAQMAFNCQFGQRDCPSGASKGQGGLFDKDLLLRGLEELGLLISGSNRTEGQKGPNEPSTSKTDHSPKMGLFNEEQLLRGLEEFGLLISGSNRTEGQKCPHEPSTSKTEGQKCPHEPSTSKSEGQKCPHEPSTSRTEGQKCPHEPSTSRSEGQTCPHESSTSRTGHCSKTGLFSEEQFFRGLEEFGLLINGSNRTEGQKSPQEKPSTTKTDQDEKETEVANVTEDGQEFRVEVNAKHFNPKGIEVKVRDGFVTVEAREEEKNEEEGTYSFRQLKKKFRLPASVDPNTVTCALTKEGCLTIKAPVKDITKPTAREVPVLLRCEHSPSQEKDSEKEETKPSKPENTN